MYKCLYVCVNKIFWKKKGEGKKVDFDLRELSFIYLFFYKVWTGKMGRWMLIGVRKMFEM